MFTITKSSTLTEIENPDFWFELKIQKAEIEKVEIQVQSLFIN